MSKRVLFVCHGNIFRSAFAKHRFDQIAKQRGLSDAASDSSGTIAVPGGRSEPIVIDVAGEYEVDLTAHRAQRVEADHLVQADRIYIMEEGMREDLLEIDPEVAPKIRLLAELEEGGGREVADIGPSPDVEATVRDRLERIDRLLNLLFDKKVGE